MTAPVIHWFRRDLRLADNPSLHAAAELGPVIPVFVLDPQTEAMGAAHRWRLAKGLEVLADRLRRAGSNLVVLRGEADACLLRLSRETGARAVHWCRTYDPASIKRDTQVKSALRDAGIEARSFPGHVLFEPWTIKTGSGSYYKVYTPFWKAVRDRNVPEPLAVPDLRAPASWPEIIAPGTLGLGDDMRRGAAIVEKYANPGEEAAWGRFGSFIGDRIGSYAETRDRLDVNGTSGLSEHLAIGEISIRTCWHAGRRALAEGSKGAETFLKELVWRDFAYHLIYHTPHIVEASWREEWRDFPWRRDNAEAEAWRRGMTGEAVIDAAMREMYVTGRMHNRARMLVASYLTKHLLTDWRVGQAWFADCLTDWDPASNALGWQWTAGSGPDAAPYFRVFNPRTQAEKFDPDGVYRETYLGDGAGALSGPAADYFKAVPRSWRLSPDDRPSAPVVDLKEGRQKALEAYSEHKEDA